MGHALITVTEKLLEDGIRTYYPTRTAHLNPSHHFKMRLSKGNKVGYQVFDRDLMYQVEVEIERLEDPYFDLIGWYMQQKAQMPWQPLSIQNQITASGSLHTCWQDHEIVECPLDENVMECPPQENKVSEDVYQDLLSLIALSEDSDENNEERQEELLAFLEEDQYLPFNSDYLHGINDPVANVMLSHGSDYSAITRLNDVLTASQPFPGDGPPIDPSYVEGEYRFLIKLIDHGLLSVYDRVQGFDSSLHLELLKDPDFVIARWYTEQCMYNSGLTSL